MFTELHKVGFFMPLFYLTSLYNTIPTVYTCLILIYNINKHVIYIHTHTHFLYTSQKKPFLSSGLNR